MMTTMISLSDLLELLLRWWPLIVAAGLVMMVIGMAAVRVAVDASPHALRLAAQQLLAELDRFDCACTARQKFNGHRTACRMPWVRAAEHRLRELVS